MEIERPIRSPDVTLQRVGAEAILHDRRNGRAHVINEPAARIWELCDGRATFDQIAEAFAAPYAMSATAVRDDVSYILDKFRELGVLT